MDEENDKTAAPVAPAPAPASARRPYEPPRVEESASFEHLVLACGHTSTFSLPCNPKKGGTIRS